MKEIGGFFELELRQGLEYHQGAYALNSARNCLRQIIRNRAVKRLCIPFYTSNSIIEALQTEGVEIQYYSINRDFSPARSFSPEEFFLYINYFGIHSSRVDEFSKHCPRMIVDNAQAFFSPPYPGRETIYSPRKFFGVPDGGYFYSSVKFDEETLPIGCSYEHFEHLIKRIDISANAAYSIFKESERSIDNAPLLRMSRLTRAILKSIDYDAVRKRRLENFNCLHQLLGDHNQLAIQLDPNDVPLVYPLLVEGTGLRAHLIERLIYVATYWPRSEAHIPPGSFEASLVTSLVPLPIDQRYTHKDMQRIADAVKNYLS